MLRFSLWRSTAAVAVALALVVVSGTASLAAKASSSGRLYVPANMIKGSAVTSGRVFYASTKHEQSLAGVRLGRQAKEILARWGNPSRITVGAPQSEGATQPNMPAGPAYIPPSPNPYESITGAMGSIYGGRLGPDALPPLQPYTPPSLTPGGTTSGTTSVLTQEEVTWTYDLPNGITLEFIITDGLITQITAGGIGPWGLSKTRTGLQLGDTYKLVLWVCGYPESQEYANGKFLRARYINKNRALFTFLQNKLVGITIALVPQELQ